jgi:hypothetical protein
MWRWRGASNSLRKKKLLPAQARVHARSLRCSLLLFFACLLAPTMRRHLHHCKLRVCSDRKGLCIRVTHATRPKQIVLVIHPSSTGGLADSARNIGG